MVSKNHLVFALTTFLTSTLAIPATFSSRQDAICSSGSPVCCDVDVLGVADLDCETPPEPYTDIKSFNDVCAAVGKINMCCLLPILEQGLICNSPDARDLEDNLTKVVGQRNLEIKTTDL
ncbi:hypothetical protein EYC80_009842 [Monilinia laxa]|uniref:Hydrophobin n=1 Tax=Monilinia laxa TaxID=61186 RepID=A0A5N6JTQ8_MONLA|nr:hypothetical protein EYC80_009842 [Monilinia laxa]